MCVGAPGSWKTGGELLLCHFLFRPASGNGLKGNGVFSAEAGKSGIPGGQEDEARGQSVGHFGISSLGKHDVPFEVRSFYDFSVRFLNSPGRP